MQLLTKLHHAGAVLALACALPASAAGIDFDDRDGAVLFTDGAPLSSEYAALGVSFAGASGTGGVLVSQYANLGVAARSGENYLGFNLDGGSAGNERISFASAQNSVSLFAATIDAQDYAVSFTLSAYDGLGNLLGSTSIAGARDWQELSLTASGIRSVVVSSDAYTWGLDDLSFSGVSPVPEPATWGMLGAGLLMMAAARRRK